MALLAVSCTHSQPHFDVASIPALPDRQGFAGMFAGTSHGALIAAGGTNFPDKPVWEGGQKQWYDNIYVLEPQSRVWRSAETKLPKPLAYGVSVTWRDEVICIGGSDRSQMYADVVALSLINHRIVVRNLPSLPSPCATACGAVVGDVIYVAGGVTKLKATQASHHFWALDLSAPENEMRWRELPPWPGAERQNAIAAAFEGSFYLMSGVQLKASENGAAARVTPLLRDVYRFTPTKVLNDNSGTWERLKDMPRAAIAAPSPTPVLSHSLVILGGGDDVENTYTDFHTHPGYARDVLLLDTTRGEWQVFENAIPARTSQVDAPVTRFENAWIVVSGEVGPGVRSPKIVRLSESK